MKSICCIRISSSVTSRTKSISDFPAYQFSSELWRTFLPNFHFLYRIRTSRQRDADSIDCLWRREWNFVLSQSQGNDLEKDSQRDREEEKWKTEDCQKNSHCFAEEKHWSRERCLIKLNKLCSFHLLYKHHRSHTVLLLWYKIVQNHSLDGCQIRNIVHPLCVP